jgi:predicted RNase H-like HicB family nuclease
MDKMKVGQLLYAEFGDKEFSAGQISNGAMAKLVQEMGITETARPALDSLVSKLLESLNGRAFRLQTGVPGYLEIRWSEGSRKAEAFQIVPIDVSGSKETDWTSDKLIGVEFPNADMTYTVLLVYSEEGYYVTCPALRGCVSQGNTEEEALENIKEAMTLWLKCEILDARKRTQSELDEELDSAFPAKLVNVKIGGIKV